MTTRPGLRSSVSAGPAQRIVLDNTLDAVEDGRLEVLKALAPLQLDDRVLNRLEVIFEELVSNVIRHGFRPGADQTIEVRVGVTEDDVELVVEDDGSPFDLLAFSESGARPSPDQPGGRGVRAVRKMASEVRYRGFAPGEGRRELGDRMFDPRNQVTVLIARKR